MKRNRYIRVTKNLTQSLILTALSVNVAHAFNSIGNSVDSFCNAEGRIPAQPYAGDCTVCHDDGVGGSGAGKTAAKNNNMDFFCQLLTTNTAPVADAGPDQSVIQNDIVTLNGTGSTDADGDALSYSWSLVTIPSGSTAVLSDPTASSPTFDADLAGTYEVELLVNDGTENSTPDTVIITAGVGNTAPIANAGPDQAVISGDTVTLDSSSSTDIDGDLLTYQWVFTSMPSGSMATLSDATAAMPTFTADIAGSYVLELIVNDGIENSSADTVSIIATDTPTVNVAPVADAGTPQAVSTNIDIVTLDGSGSTDADGDNLTYSWTFTSIPAGSFAFLSAPNTIQPTFIADVDGDYVIQLIVNDGTVDSMPSTVKITATTDNQPPVNIAPIANAGNDQNIQPGNTVSLDGQGSSDANNDPLTYTWSFLTMPVDSMTTLSGPASATPSFVADVVGDYVIQLIVNDGQADSEPSTVMIKVNDQPVVKPNIALSLKVSPSTLKVEMDELGEESVKVKANITQKSSKHRKFDGMDSVPVLINIDLTKPDGSVETLVQQHHTVKRSARTAIRFTPKMEGDYIVNAIVNDEAGNQLASETKTVTVMVKEGDHDDDHEEDHEDDYDDEHEDDHNDEHDHKDAHRHQGDDK